MDSLQWQVVNYDSKMNIDLLGSSPGMHYNSLELLRDVIPRGCALFFGCFGTSLVLNWELF